jgi:hypothetical protein
MLLMWCVCSILLVGAHAAVSGAHAVDLQNVLYGREVFNKSAFAAGTDKAISHTYHKM